jgi:hypothetical protein
LEISLIKIQEYAVHFPLTPEFLHISNRGNSLLPLKNLILIGTGAKSSLDHLCQAGSPQATYDEESWSLFESENVRWRATAHLCGLTDLDFFIWTIDPLYIAQNGVSSLDQEALNLIRSLGSQKGIIWFLEAPRITSIEIFSAQNKIKKALADAQFKPSASIVTILPRKTSSDVLKHLDQLFEVQKKEEQKRVDTYTQNRSTVPKEPSSIEDGSPSDGSPSDGHTHPPLNQREWPRRYIDAFVPIPKGQFIGVEDREFSVDHPFFLAQTTVTQSLYQSVMQKPAPIPLGAHYPVVKISWLDCLYFCNLLSEMQNLTPYYKIEYHKDEIGQESLDVSIPNPRGPGYRLPTFNEWCYSAGAGQRFPYPGSENHEDVAWSAHNSGSKVHPVAQLRPNRWGVYDLCGNVWEWCQDGPKDDQFNQLCTSPLHPKWLLGGSWANHPWIFPIGEGLSELPIYQDDFMGFRVARNQKEDL